MRWRCCPLCVVMLKDCFIRPSGLYLYPSGPSPSESPFDEPSGDFPDARLATGAAGTALPPRLPSISRYVRKLPETRLALHDFPSVHRLMPASRSSQTNTEPDFICWRSFSDRRRCTRGNIPMRQASNRMMASLGVRTCPWYVSMVMVLMC